LTVLLVNIAFAVWQ